ncbi:MAG: DUF368 domain-containing protein [Coriobacteriia bacterium]|nr:DUF368 domain-containing protein [Coriobacteriia bacterium]
MLNYLYRILCGFFLGLSVFAPGLSGAVIAIIMGVYKDIVEIAANPFKNLKRNILWCIPIGIGVVLSGIVFILLFDFLFETYEKATYLLFLGLIAGNLPVIYAEIKKYGFKLSYLWGGFAAFAIALALFFAGTQAGMAADATQLSAGIPLLIAAGFAGGAAMLVPGMSVSMVLIVFGVYRQLIYAAKTLIDLDLTYLIPFGLFALCAIAGVVLSSRAIKWVFEKIPGLAYTMIFGFMASSILGLIIQSIRLQDSDFSWLLGAIMLVVGLGISMMFVYLSRKMNIDELDSGQDTVSNIIL